MGGKAQRWPLYWLASTGASSDSRTSPASRCPDRSEGLQGRRLPGCLFPDPVRSLSSAVSQATAPLIILECWLAGSILGLRDQHCMHPTMTEGLQLVLLAGSGEKNRHYCSICIAFSYTSSQTLLTNNQETTDGAWRKEKTNAL